MRILVDRRRKARATLERAHPGATFLDVTSRGPEPWVRFSPFFPHGGIPVPFTQGRTAASVEGIWQGLKVFARADVDPSRFDVRTMSGIKRSARQLGAVQGHREGLSGARLLGYREARYRIYLLEHHLSEPLNELRRLAERASSCSSITRPTSPSTISPNRSRTRASSGASSRARGPRSGVDDRVEISVAAKSGVEPRGGRDVRSSAAEIDGLADSSLVRDLV